MILSRREILSYLKEGRLQITPEPSPDDIDQVSIDLRLGRTFTELKELPDHIGSVRIAASIFDAQDLWDQQEASEFVLKPKQLVLAHTFEKIRIPSDVVGLVEGRSSWARIGVSIHITAPKIDPGFNGTITLEMANLGRAPVTLRAELDKPAQLMFVRLSEPLKDEELYGGKADDIFQDQTTPIPHKRMT